MIQTGNTIKHDGQSQSDQSLRSVTGLADVKIHGAGSHSARPDSSRTARYSHHSTHQQHLQSKTGAGRSGETATLLLLGWWSVQPLPVHLAYLQNTLICRRYMLNNCYKLDLKPKT